jgi:hypothetical protein
MTKKISIVAAIIFAMVLLSLYAQRVYAADLNRQNIIKGLYKSLLGREADAGGLNNYYSGKLTSNGIRQSILNSDECRIGLGGECRNLYGQPNIVSASFSPQPAVQNQSTTVRVTTDRAAARVVVKFKDTGREIPLQGSAKNWSATISMPNPGSIPYLITAFDRGNRSGQQKSGSLQIVQPTYSLSGVVRAYYKNGPLLPGAMVSIDGKSVLTDDKGKFNISGVMTGSKALKISKMGHIGYANPSYSVNGNSNNLSFYLKSALFGNFDAFVRNWNGKGINVDHAAGDQCMDLMHQYTLEVLGLDALHAPTAYQAFLNGDSRFMKITRTAKNVPRKGDIVFWNTSVGPTGHVAVFIEGTANRFSSFDQNWPKGAKAHTQVHNYNGVVGWLRLK